MDDGDLSPEKANFRAVVNQTLAQHHAGGLPGEDGPGPSLSPLHGLGGPGLNKVAVIPPIKEAPG